MMSYRRLRSPLLPAKLTRHSKPFESSTQQTSRHKRMRQHGSEQVNWYGMLCYLCFSGPECFRGTFYTNYVANAFCTQCWAHICGNNCFAGWRAKVVVATIVWKTRFCKTHQAHRLAAPLAVFVALHVAWLLSHAGVGRDNWLECAAVRNLREELSGQRQPHLRFEGVLVEDHPLGNAAVRRVVDQSVAKETLNFGA